MRYGETPLYITAWSDVVATATLLVERGAAVNAKTNNGDTPLAEALDFGSDETAALLRQHGGKK